MTDNLYAILGVDNKAEIEVINAAHKALAKKYHPDTYIGDKKFAEDKLKKINAAFDTLSDTKKRKKYDDKVAKDGAKPNFDEDEQFDGSESGEEVLNEDWSVVIEVYPEAEFVRKSLYVYSPKLSFTFQIIILSSKSAAQAMKIGKVLKSEFLVKYFGNNQILLRFVERLLFTGKRDIASDINKKILILGSDASEKVLADIKVRYKDKLKDIYSKNYTFEQSVANFNDAAKRAAFEKSQQETGKSDKVYSTQTKSRPMGFGFYLMIVLLCFMLSIPMCLSSM